MLGFLVKGRGKGDPQFSGPFHSVVWPLAGSSLTENHFTILILMSSLWDVAVFQFCLIETLSDSVSLLGHYRMLDLFLLLLFGLFLLFRAGFAISGSPQARGQIRAAAAVLHYSHSNMGSDSHLPPAP